MGKYREIRLKTRKALRFVAACSPAGAAKLLPLFRWAGKEKGALGSLLSLWQLEVEVAGTASTGKGLQEGGYSQRRIFPASHPGFWHFPPGSSPGIRFQRVRSLLWLSAVPLRSLYICAGNTWKPQLLLGSLDF